MSVKPWRKQEALKTAKERDLRRRSAGPYDDEPARSKCSYKSLDLAGVADPPAALRRSAQAAESFGSAGVSVSAESGIDRRLAGLHDSSALALLKNPST